MGTKWLLYWPLSWSPPEPFVLDLFASWSSNLLPRQGGAFATSPWPGLAHQESSSTISEPLFKDKLLAKSRQWREEQSPEPPLVRLDAASTARTPDSLTRHLLGLRTHHASACLSTGWLLPPLRCGRGSFRLISACAHDRSMFWSDQPEPPLRLTDMVQWIPVHHQLTVQHHARNRWRVLCQEVGNRPP